MKIRTLNKQSNVIGKNIRKYRNSRGYSQREVCNKLALLGVNMYHSDLSDIENSKHHIKDYEILALCKVLNITREEIFEGTDNIFN
jgi:transcriptional regulator with XRE-family HTH domain